jgi:hypothetical protein
MKNNRLIFDYNLTQFLSSNSNIISLILLNGDSDILNTEYNYICKTDDNSISYLTLSKINISDNIYDVYSLLNQEKNRTTIKVGRFISKIINKNCYERFSITNKMIEEFVNLYKSYFNSNEKNLHVVSNNDIKKWYLEDNYLSTNHNSTLWKSCMRQEHRNRFLELYTKNNQVKMLIFLDDNNKLRSRAILWDNVFDTDGNQYKLMDRIYSVYDHDVNIFKKWAKENNYIVKSEQNSKSELSFEINGERKSMNMYIKLDYFKLKYYPYLDTFKYFDPEKGYLYNYLKHGNLYKLTRTDGNLTDESDYIEEADFYDYE